MLQKRHYCFITKKTLSVIGNGKLIDQLIGNCHLFFKHCLLEKFQFQEQTSDKAWFNFLSNFALLGCADIATAHQKYSKTFPALHIEGVPYVLPRFINVPFVSLLDFRFHATSDTFFKKKNQDFKIF